MTSSGSHRDFIINIILKSAAKVKPFCRFFQYLNRPFLGLAAYNKLRKSLLNKTLIEKAPAEFTEDECNETADGTWGITPYRT